ncbi:antitoxin Xre/MbcA/ParS toxin-binding domain-containing protein [Sphingorhabdus arenilitoris]|uniref:Antitoxin Xre/MbcA/ParS toxin-binding domain-containing protein n=1 Tax=Sphingorhabdus arenilitoris TaxID=1490041 RepID=A0ABV8RE07_9SPHN
MQYPDTKTAASKSGAVREMPMTFAAGPGFPGFGGAFLDGFFTKKGLIDIAKMLSAFHMSRAQFAETTGLPLTTVTKADRLKSAKAQGRMTEMLEIIARIRDWAGSDTQAMAWYRSQPIPALDGRTAESLVKSGDAAAVRDYLDHMALGGFA